MKMRDYRVGKKVTEKSADFIGIDSNLQLILTKTTDRRLIFGGKVYYWRPGDCDPKASEGTQSYIQGELSLFVEC